MIGDDFVLPGHTIIGTCSKCGGNVCVPTIWGSVVPAVPTCSSCGAIAKRNYNLPTIETEEPRKIEYKITTNTNL